MLLFENTANALKNYEGRRTPAKVKESNKQMMQDLKFLANRMDRRDERLKQEAPPVSSCQLGGTETSVTYDPWHG